MSKVGYQGMFGSNSHIAAQKLASAFLSSEVEFVPLVTSKNVVNALKNNEIDYGVLAVNNNVAGEVIETTTALDGFDYNVCGDTVLEIRHCVFTTHTCSKVATVASHIQALQQCKNTIMREFPTATTQELEDTAIGAYYLSNATLNDNTAVICPQFAGEHYNLKLIYKDAQDMQGNATEFILISK